MAVSLRHPAFVLVECDIASPAVRGLVAQADVVIHLAAQPGVRGGWGDSFDTYLQENLVATQRLLEHMAAPGAAGRAKLVYASTSSVYGETMADTVTEAHPTHPTSPYGATKLAAEHLIRVYARNHEFPCVILRYFTVYGPRQRPDMAFQRFITAAFTGTPVPFYGDGSQERDFTYVEDIVAATCAAATGPVTGVTLNIAGGRPQRLDRVVELIREYTGHSLQMEQKPFPRYEMSRTAADISLARSLLGYQPRVALEEGLKRQIEYVAANLDANKAGMRS